MDNIATRTLNIRWNSEDPRASLLSNFAKFPIVVYTMYALSVEGAIQGIKFPLGDPNRVKAFNSYGPTAKKFGRLAGNQFVWWGECSYSYGGSFHKKLVRKFIIAKFEQNPKALLTLLDTGNLVLIHDLGRPENPNTSLKAEEFCRILTKIRSEAQMALKK